MRSSWTSAEACSSSSAAAARSRQVSSFASTGSRTAQNPQKQNIARSRFPPRTASRAASTSRAASGPSSSSRPAWSSRCSSRSDWTRSWRTDGSHSLPEITGRAYVATGSARAVDASAPVRRAPPYPEGMPSAPPLRARPGATGLAELVASGGRSFSFEFFPPKDEAGAVALWRDAARARAAASDVRLRDLRRRRVDP